MTNWRGVVDELAQAKSKAQRLYDGMKPSEAAKILLIHGERAQEACALATQKDDQVVVNAIFEMSTIMMEVGNDMTERWHEAIESTPAAIRSFMLGGDIEQRIAYLFDRKRRQKEWSEQHVIEVKPLSEEDIMKRVAHAVSDEFACEEWPYQINDQVFEVPVGDGKVIEFCIKKMKT